jgi:tetratricopeptide (TPR) repeat protein
MLKRIAGLVVAGAVCLANPAAWSKTGPHFDEGVKQLKGFEYEAALGAFEKALDWPGNTKSERALILVYIGIAQSNQADYTKAEESFKKALAEDPAVQPPKLTSPKIRALFEKVKTEAGIAAPTPVEPTDPSTPGTTRLWDPEQEMERPEDKESQPSKVNWPAWITLGAAVAAGGAGVAMGAMNLSAKSKAEDKTVPFGEAQDHADKASTLGLAANILFAAAGAAAVTSGVLFYLDYRKNKKPRQEEEEEEGEEEQSLTSVVPLVTQSGVMIQLEVRR